MALVITEFSSDFRDEPLELGRMTDGKDGYLGSHDPQTGTFVLSRCLRNESGVEVYRFDKLDGDRNAAMLKLADLICGQNVYRRLLPWFESEPIPFHLDTGEPGALIVRHQPYFIVDAVRGAYEL